MRQTEEEEEEEEGGGRRRKEEEEEGLFKANAVEHVSHIYFPLIFRFAA